MANKQSAKSTTSRKKTALVLSFGVLVLASLVGTGLVNKAVEEAGDLYIRDLAELEAADCVIVPGALVRDGRPSPMLQDRLDVALQVYQSGVTDRILVSGDHGQADYDEVNVMRQYLLDHSVPAEHIFMDHAGFDTYATIYRAREVFLVKKAIIVTQDFHLRRALYIAHALGLQAQGVASDPRIYPRATYYRFREYAARVKAYAESYVFKARPAYLGETIPITGSGLATVD